MLLVGQQARRWGSKPGDREASQEVGSVVQVKDHRSWSCSRASREVAEINWMSWAEPTGEGLCSAGERVVCPASLGDSAKGDADLSDGETVCTVVV